MLPTELFKTRIEETELYKVSIWADRYREDMTLVFVEMNEMMDRLLEVKQTLNTALGTIVSLVDCLGVFVEKTTDHL